MKTRIIQDEPPERPDAGDPAPASVENSAPDNESEPSPAPDEGPGGGAPSPEGRA